MEGKAITTEIIRGAVKVEGLVAEVCEERKKTIPLRLVTCLEFSFRSIKQINFLVGFECLTRLLLDNNHLTKIENIAHLTTLKELDLSFNNIEIIEGLETLTNLTDLSLFSNKITKLEGLETLEDLVCLSLGNNFISELEDVAYFRQFRKLRLLVLSGNPICKDPEYRLFVVAFMRNMLYLDHKLCFKHQIDQAKDEYQDELQELKEKELQEEEDIKNRLAKRAEMELYEKANLIGVDGLFDKMLKDDPEHARLSEVPTLLEGLDEFREKHQTSTAELKSLVIELYYKEQAELKLWQSAMTEDVNQKDEESRSLVNTFDELKKKTIQEAFQDRASGEEKLKNLLVENDALQYKLMELEVVCFDQVQHLWKLFEETFYTMIECGKQHVSNYFGVLRNAENKACETIMMQAGSLLEKYILTDMDEEVESDAARMLLKDKEALIGAIQASHDAHTLTIDSSENEKLKNEEQTRKKISEEAKFAAIKRNRERIQEIWYVHDNNVKEIKEELQRLLRPIVSFSHDTGGGGGSHRTTGSSSSRFGSRFSNSGASSKRSNIQRISTRKPLQRQTSDPSIT